MWVVATLVWSAVGGYQRSVGRLSDAELDAFYRDMRTHGTFFGLPADYGPRTYAEYLDYFEKMAADESLGSHPVSRRVAWAVARPRTPWWLRLAGRPMTFIYSEVLPPPVAKRLGFRRTIWSRASMAAATLFLRRFARFAPHRLRLVPQYLEALAAATPAPAADQTAAAPGQRRSLEAPRPPRPGSPSRLCSGDEV
jgi:uncharacterized protein (DUF2236 family)